VVIAVFPPRRHKFEPVSGHVEFVVDKLTLGPISSGLKGNTPKVIRGERRK
jgi:hypothetical protein